MRLTDLKCPRCSGLLNQQCDRFYCSSCGAAFEVDYEDTDVEYSKLVTEAERTKLMIERDKEVLRKEYELNESFKDEEARRKFNFETKRRTRNAVQAMIISIVTIIVMFLLMIGLVVYIIFACTSRATVSSKMRGQEEEEARALTAEQILEDPNFLYNAAADGISTRAVAFYERPYVIKIYGEERECELVGLPTPVGAYIESETKDFHGRNYTDNKFYIAYKLTYKMTDTDEDETVDIYTYAEFRDIERQPGGRINYSSEYKGALEVSYTSCFELEQLEREKFDNAEKIDVSEFFGEGGDEA